MRIYLLSDYEEHGSRNMVGTTDPDKLESMLAAHWGKYGGYEADLRDLREALSEETTGIWTLGRGWGGPQLHILDLDSESIT